MADPIGPVAVHPGAPVAVAALSAGLLASGFGLGVQGVCIGMVFARTVPRELQSRTRGVYQTVSFGMRPIGALAGGFGAAAIGERPVLLGAAVLGGLASLWLLRSSLLRANPG
ncbi:hypothetical protein [Kutzneria chonburiensis]|uniref:MFS transporter n=1 Tax=Kutzneria chonburiensis TaxID=1483604 RepID=A0ABV6MZ75_9PSEU|nr:hypothetical protein [Kutzneria chonburiensis]